MSVKDILDGKASGLLNVIGIVTRLKKRQNKNKEEWAQFVIEDCTGSIAVNAFARAWANVGHKVAPNAILCFSGKVNVDDESARVEINLKDVAGVPELIGNIATKLTIRLTPDYSAENLQRLKMLLEAAKGITKVYLEVPSKADPSKLHIIRTGKSIMIHRALLEFLENTLGSDAWSFQ